MSLTRFEEAERAERKAQDNAAKERILRRLGWRPTTLDDLAAALTTSQAPAAILTCREVTARRLRDLADDGLIVPDDGLIVPDGAAWRLKGDARTCAEPPPPSPSPPSTRAGEVSAPPLTDPEPTMPKTAAETKQRAAQTLDRVRRALAAYPNGVTVQELAALTGILDDDAVRYALKKLKAEGVAEVTPGQTRTEPGIWRPTQRQPIAKAEPAPAHDVTCYDIETEKAAREPSAIPAGASLAVAVIHAALDAAGCPAHPDPLHRIEVLGDSAREHQADAAAYDKILRELGEILNFDGYRRLPELVRRLTAPRWLASPVGDLCIVGAKVLVCVTAHAPAGTRRQAEILDDSGKMLARVSLNPAWPEDRWKPLLLDIRTKLMDPELSEIPF